MQITINLPDTFEVTSRDMTVGIVLSDLPAELFAKAALHGIKQKVSDAAAGAALAAFRNKDEGETAEAFKKAFDAFKDDKVNELKIAETGLALMQKAVASLVAGEWKTARGTGDKLSDVEIEMAKLFADGAKLKFPKGMKTPERYADALGQLETRPEETQKAVRRLAEETVARKAREDAALAAKLGNITF
jgi:hypothetical protein